MTPPHRRVGILSRVIIHGFALLVLMAVFIVLGFRLLVEPAMRGNRDTFPLWLAQHAAVSLDDPTALARELADTRTQTGTEISVYDRSDTLVASNTSPPLVATRRALDAASNGERAVPSEPDVLVARLDHRGAPFGYAVMRHHFPAFPRTRVLLVLGACLVLAAIASVPLSRSLVRPILALERATHRLGGGDLSTRVALQRTDEIGDLARAFDEMAARIASFVRAEKELLANVSHELRTPLSRIRVVLELASEGDPARVQRYLTEIAHDLAELDRLVEDVLTAAKLDLAEGKVGAGSVPMRFDDVALDALVERSRARFGSLYPDRALTVRISRPLPIVRCDQVMMRRALDNLLDNAVKHAPAPAGVEIVAAPEGDGLDIEVRDDGPGMAPHVAERAFEPFYRGDASRDRRTGGVGLGLSLVRRIVEAHGGRVSLSTAPDQGTAILVHLPSVDPSRHAPMSTHS
ncbi:periplasmic sensor signal transduction histidine kinase [Minicystis rosea]|nr:periplasmic sensor signal transduction histidine kinase [Minicystis rosea]